jgi:ABC-type phosphate transport system ATPase subunit
MALARTKKAQETVTLNVSDIDFIKTKLVELSQKVDSVDKTCEKLNTTIIGDTRYGQIGLIEKQKAHDIFIEECKNANLIQKVKDHDEYIQTDKSFKAKLVGGGVAVGVFWTFILKFWDKIF